MRERIPHIIKKNAQNETPGAVLFFDTETRELPGEKETQLFLRLGVACLWGVRDDTEKWYQFKTANEFWELVESIIPEKRKLYLVAHNVAFDFRVLQGFAFMKLRGFAMRKFIYNGTSNIWEFKKDKKTICILDNMNFFKSSLKVLGHSIGLEKMDMPDTDDDYIMFEYCTRDVAILLSAWRKFFIFMSENNLGNFSKTIAGQAFASYRHRFMFTPIYIHTNKKAIEIERESYHGGRTEAFFIGEAPRKIYTLLDVNSMYPAVMGKNDYPTKLVRITGKLSLRSARLYLSAYCMIARCSVDTDKPVFPVKINGKLIFPVGKFETVLTTREIQFGMARGYIKKITEAVLYEKYNLFSEYVKFFFAKKKEYKEVGNEAFTFMCKLFLNSLYGKFGQRNEQFETIAENQEVENGLFRHFDMDKNKFITERRINGRVESSTGELREGNDAFVAIASHVTADARIKLFEYIETAGRKNTFYCDTDSVIVNMAGFQNLKKEIGPSLGQLGLKKQSYILKIYGAKDYVFGKEETIKGIRKDAERIDDTTFMQSRFEGIAGALRNMRPDKMFISKTIKHLSRNYDKGKILPNGRVIPFSLIGDKLLNKLFI